MSYKDIEILSNLKEDIVNNKKSTLKLEYRKKMYETFIKGNEELTEEYVEKYFEFLIANCSVIDSKYDIPFFKKVERFYKEKEDYNKLLYWLNKYDKEILNKNPFKNKKFSDYDVHVLYVMECYVELQLIGDAEKLCKEYDIQDLTNNTFFWLKYKLTKLYYIVKKEKEAECILIELLRHKREKYLLAMPLKYLSNNETFALKCIYELTLKEIEKNEEYIIFNIMYWLNKNTEMIITEKTGNFIIDDLVNNKCQFQKFINNFSETKLLKMKLLLEGKIIKIFNGNFGFVQTEGCSNYYNNINNIYLELGDKIKYIIVDGYNNKKREATTIALVGGKL